MGYVQLTPVVLGVPMLTLFLPLSSCSDPQFFQLLLDLNLPKSTINNQLTLVTYSLDWI